ncbi:MAG: LppX_LprAFG lipoprotein [Nocardioides sp.]|nr:LppX_LprAFG lipoprotein [Nocardioides sp.]
MPLPRAGSRLAPVLLSAALLVTSLGACSGKESPAEERSPDEVLALAADHLTETSGVELALTTEDLPSGVSGIKSAIGTATSAPAFEGTIAVVVGGTPVDVPVIAVDDVVHAQLPFTNGWNVVDPTEYGAPDPSGLIDPDDGFPGLLGLTEDATEGESVRGGADNDEILTTYDGTVPGPAMAKVIPSATGDSFDVQWQVADDGELRKAVLTGVFYADTPEMTYTVTFADYGTEKDITAP